MKVEDRSNTQMLEKLQFSITHNFTTVSYPYCKMCKTTKVLAGMHCVTCGPEGGDGMDMCRPCCRRIHAHETIQHEFYPI